MDADLDTLCTFIYCTADDLLPEARRTPGAASPMPRWSRSAWRRRSWASPVTAGSSPWRESASSISSRSCPASPPTGSAGAGWPTRSSGSWACSPSEPGLHGRPAAGRLDPGALRRQPGDGQALGARRRGRLRLLRRPLALLLGLSPAPAGRSRRHAAGLHARRSAARRAGGGLELLERCTRAAARSWSATRATPGASSPPSAAELGVLVVRPGAKGRARPGPHLAPIRQRIESIFWTCKDLLTLERHGARTLAGLRERVLQRFLCLAACISLNHRLGRPSRALVDYCA